MLSKCINYNEIYIDCSQVLNIWVSLHENNIRLQESRKLYISKNLYDYSNGYFKILPIYQISDYSLLQTKEKNDR